MNEEQIFAAAIQRVSDAERIAFLDGACGDDHALRARIEALLLSHEDAGTFLNEPAAPEVTLDSHGKVAERAMIGPYKLLQKIGEGGMGAVYMAEQSSPVQRRVALKIIRPGMASDEVLARFEAERQALAMMDHPNIAKIYEAGVTESGRPYFVMELVKGLPITEYCDDQQLTISDRVQLFTRVCRAIQHAHQKGIIHRDLKPSNVLVAKYDSHPVPKVIDFGVAKAVSQRLTERTMFTQFGQIVGTLEYMSPEQAQFNQLDVDTRTDVYSLGVLLYQLLTGETPIDGERLRSSAFDEMLRILREEEPPKPSLRISTMGDKALSVSGRRIDASKLGGSLRGDLDWIVMKSLEKERSRRYDTASNFADDLERCLRDEPVEARPPSSAYMFRKFYRRNKALVATAAVVALSMVAIMLVSIWQTNRVTTERDRARAAEQAASEARQDAVGKQQELQDTLDELHSVLIDKINLEMGGADEAMLKAAIDQAEHAGVDERELRLLRGQQAFFYGRPADAVGILAPIADTSIAALALMAEAQLQSGAPTDRDEIVLRLIERVNRTEKLTTLDRLFAALSLMDKNTATSRKLVEDVLEHRDSPFNRLIVSKVLAAYAHQHFDKHAIQESIRHLNAAIAFGGNSVSFLEGELMVKHIAWSLGAEGVSEVPTEKLAVLQEVFADNPMGKASIVRFLSDVGHKDAAKIARAYFPDSTDIELLYYVPILLRHQSPEQTLSDLENRGAPTALAKVLMARLMTLIPGRKEEARAMCHKLVDADTNFGLRLNCYMTLNLLGYADEAHARSKELLGSTRPPVWYHTKMLDYFAKKIDAVALLEGSEGRVEQLHARFVLATEQLGKGEVEAARENLRDCLELGQFHSENHHFAQAFLDAIENDADWIKRLRKE